LIQQLAQVSQEARETISWRIGVVDPDSSQGVYGIGVAAELVGTGVQNLRLYEARGLLDPDRTSGGTRRYSADDIDRLRRIGELLLAGLNLAGIAMVLALETENAQLLAERKQQHSARGTGGVEPTRPGVSTTVTLA
jgi:MerR family transcriptional regulator/heat shock protein HspR